MLCFTDVYFNINTNNKAIPVTDDFLANIM